MNTGILGIYLQNLSSVFSPNTRMAMSRSSSRVCKFHRATAAGQGCFHEQPGVNALLQNARPSTIYSICGVRHRQAQSEHLTNVAA